MSSIMKINTYEAWVRLGCLPDEQAYVQPVHFDVEIVFDQAVAAEQTDQINDAVDYVRLTEIIHQTATAKPYHLVEHMCSQVMNKLIVYLFDKRIKGHIKVSLTKLRVPVAHLQAGVTWTCQKDI